MNSPKYLILPSLFAADITDIGGEITKVIDAGADMIHLDVMDNHYVPNLTFGPIFCEKIINKYPNISIDVHLMTTPVDDLIIQFAKAGATRISIHPDATIHLERSLNLIKQYNCQAGIGLNPTTTIECLQWCQHCIDFVLVMTVNPGFSGQNLIPEIMPKIALIKKHFPNLPISVDGGVSLTNIVALATSGATQFVAGAAIFATQDYQKTITKMRHILRTL